MPEVDKRTRKRTNAKDEKDKRKESLTTTTITTYRKVHLQIPNA